MTVDHQPAPAEPRRRRRFSLIWLIPIAAAASALWLGYHSLSNAGPSIEIGFDTAEGLEAGHTKIRHKDVDLGTVEKITLSKDLNRVVVLARMTSEAAPYLTEGARFWVVKPRVTLGQISGLTTILSGAYIEFSPGRGAARRHFEGLVDPPVMEAEVPGSQFVLTSDRLNSITQGSPIYFRGVTVGEVLGTELDDASQNVKVHVFVRAPHDRLVHPQSHFWNVSGFAVDAGAEGIHLATESLQSLLLGGIEFDTPKTDDAGPAKPGAAFPLLADENAIADEPRGPKYQFVAMFPGSVQNLAAQSVVLLQGIPVGHVESIDLSATPNGAVSIPVTFDVEPERLLGPDAERQLGPGRAGLDHLLGKMIDHGLRARLMTASFITGNKMVSLDFQADAATAKLDLSGPVPQFPTIGGGDLDGIMSSAQGFLDHLAALPLGGLVADIRQTLQATAATISSPEMKHSLHSLDVTLANLADSTTEAKTDIGPTLKSLRNAASEADATLAGAHGQPGLGTLMGELTDAARSLRVMADYLDRHPEALLRGKASNHE